MTFSIDVALVPDEVATTSTPPDAVAVIDVVRATTAISTALAAGARSVRPVVTVEEARRAAATNGALLCGERFGLPPEGFDLGNSPRDYTPETVGGRDLVFTTTNGTLAMQRAIETGADRIWLSCFRNADAVAARIRTRVGARESANVLIVCAGRRGRVSMDDAWCAGHLVGRLASEGDDPRLSDGAELAHLLATRLGRPDAPGLARFAAGAALTEIGLQEDLAVCARVGDLDVAPVEDDGVFVRGGDEEGV